MKPSLSPSRRSIARRLTPWLVFFAAFLYYITYYNYGISMTDEGIFVNSSLRILDGQVPYLDYQYYPPALNYILSGMFSVLGTNLLYERLLFVLILSLCAAATYLVSERITPFPFPLISTVLFVLTPGPWHKCTIPMILLLATLAGASYINSPGYRRATLCGFVAGLSIYFRLDTAGFASISLFILIIAANSFSTGRFQPRPAPMIRHLAAYLVSLVIGLLPAAVFLAYLQIKSGYFSYMLGRIFSAKSDMGLPFPAPDISKAMSDFSGFYFSAIYYIPIVLYLATTVILLVAMYKRRIEKKHLTVFLLLIMGIFSYNQTLVRTDYPHILQSIHIPYILFAYLASELYKYLSDRSLSRLVLLSAYFVVAVSVIAVAGHSYLNIKLAHPYGGTVGIVSGKTARLDIKLAPVILKPEDARTIQEQVNYIREATGPNEAILCIPYMPMLYFLSQRENPTRFDGIFPGTLRTQEITSEFWSSVRKANVRVVAMNDASFTGNESGRFSVYAKEVNSYILDNYSLDRTIGGVGFYVPKMPSQPDITD